MAISSPSGLFVADDPMRSTGLQPFSAGRLPTTRIVCSWQNGVISTGRGNPGPSALHSLDSSTMTMNFFAMISTIFSRRSAPPPPLTRKRLGSTSSAPSIATSSSERSLSVHSGMPSSSACSLVRTDVGMHMMSFSVPSLRSCPTRSTANAAVEPVPSPTVMPDLTWSSTALYPTSFLSSSCDAAMARTLVRPILCVLRRGAVVLLSLRECEVRRAIARGSVCE
mmetsp:Transcript_14259/g.37830  ORF Transcript_14259/g.37830 Transcript_14259/m.37830 type:complete len:224 (-) Transcript_14259:16-687(-)